MKETRFIEQNKEKWLKFEQLLRLNKRNPDQLSDLFIQITDDLSYARTNYPNRSIRIYLNNIAQQLFYNIYKNKKEGKNKFIRFWKEELPSIAYHARRELLLSLLVFLLAVLIGVVSSANDPDFVRTILGNNYVDMTLENIEKGDPMGVYKRMNEVDMFLGITFNNVMIAFRTFITGIFFSLGSVIVLIYNGIMLGSFQYFFLEKGLVAESMLTIWLHGTLEISSIIIAGGAGIVLGKGFVFPGTYTRLRAFQQSARTGLKLLIGIVPILVFAAIIESFLTRYTDVPNLIKLLLILASLGFIIFYFVWLPYAKYHNGTLVPVKNTSSQIGSNAPLRFEGGIRKMNEIFRDALIVYKNIFKSYIMPMLAVAVLYVVASGYSLWQPIKNGLIPINVWVFKKLSFLLDYQSQPFLFFVNSIFIASIIYFSINKADKLLNYEADKNRLTAGSLLAAILLNTPMFLNGFFSFMFFIILFPISIYGVIIFIKERRSFLSALSQVLSHISESFARILGLFSLMSFIIFIFFILIDSPFFAFYLDFVQSNFIMDADLTYYLSLAVNGLIITLGIILIIPLVIISFDIQYYSLIEIRDATSLKVQIEEFGTRKY